MLPEAGRVSVPLWDIGLTGKLEYDVRVQALYDLSQAMEIKCIKAECYQKLAECQFHRGILTLRISWCRM